ncbi:MAG: hypothetical protein JRG96_14055 [Deltaproteobacteria bacterium]|nr:hypothetical protein [Deltaproteobacteria bacterium]MBW2418020.1 hypothetical protein [Deltaproteobacteria bacterium]
MAGRARQARSQQRRGTRPNPLQHRQAAARRAGRDSRPSSCRTEPDHHLWRNGRLWWVAFTVIHEGWRQERVRVSLQTDDVVEDLRWDK